MISDGEVSLRLLQQDQLKSWLPAPVLAMARRCKKIGQQLCGVKETQWARVIMDREAEKFVRGLQYSSFDVLEIAGTKWERFGFRSYRSVQLPEYNVCQGPLGVEAFDIVIAEQVLEHVLWPYRAVCNVWQTLRPGGIFIVTTPFLIRIHEVPVDCSRWTELGLKHLLIEGGFDNQLVLTGSWGNRACVCANFRKWKGWIPWKHSLKNEPAFPVVVWAFARKGGLQ